MAKRKRAAREITLRRVAGDEWELVPPRCAVERADDLEEVHAMLAAGETEIAVDELRWLLDGCPHFLAAHRLLGELAVEAGDLKLARGHFGIAVQLGLQATQDLRGTLPYRLPANQAFHESGRGLVWCLVQLGKRDMAQDILEKLLRLDPADPLEVRKLLSSQGDGLLPIVS